MTSLEGKDMNVKNKICCSIVFLASLLISLSLNVSAASVNTFHLDELGMSIDIPSDLMVILSDSSYIDPRFDEIGVDTSELLSIMKSGNAYLDAIEENIDYEISVTMVNNDINDFNEYSDAMLLSFADSIESDYLPLGITVNSFEVYPARQAKFIRFDLSQSDGNSTEYGLQYYTVYDHKAINIILRSYSGIIDANKESIVSTIVDSATFDKEPSYTSDNESLVFEDSKSGCKFTIPDEWWQSSTWEENGALYATISSNIEAKTNIVYTCADIWNELSDAEKLNLPRDRYNNAAISEDYVAGELGISRDSITRTTYANQEYFKAVTRSSELIDGSDDGMITTLTKVENGYLHLFMFSGDSTSPYYKDFESLLNSVQYANYTDEKDAGVSTSVIPQVDNSTDLDDKASNFRSDSDSSNDIWEGADYTFAGIIISLLITVAVCTLPIIIYRYAILKHPVERSKAKKITIIYGIIAFFIMLTLHLILNDGDFNGVNGAAIVVWSTVNYNILLKDKKKKDKKARKENQAETSESASKEQSVFEKPISSKSVDIFDEWANLSDKATISSIPKTDHTQVYEENRNNSASVKTEPSVIYCHKCGAKLPSDADFCYKCGTKLIKEDLHDSDRNTDESGTTNKKKVLLIGLLGTVAILILSILAYNFVLSKNDNQNITTHSNEAAIGAFTPIPKASTAENGSEIQTDESTTSGQNEKAAEAIVPIQYIETIASESIDVYSSASTNSPIIGAITEGQVVQVISSDIQGDNWRRWHQVKLKNDATGYVSEDAVTISRIRRAIKVSESEEKQESVANTINTYYEGTIVAEITNVRSAATSQSSILGSLERWQTLSVTGPVVNPDGIVWYEVVLEDGSHGYINGRFITVVTKEDTANSPIEIIRKDEDILKAAYTKEFKGTLPSLSTIIQSEPFADSTIIGYGEQGDVVSVNGYTVNQDGQLWYEVILDDESTGYIRGDYVLLQEE